MPVMGGGRAVVALSKDGLSVRPAVEMCIPNCADAQIRAAVASSVVITPLAI